MKHAPSVVPARSGSIALDTATFRDPTPAAERQSLPSLWNIMPKGLAQRDLQRFAGCASWGLAALSATIRTRDHLARRLGCPSVKGSALGCLWLSGAIADAGPRAG
jgi:hypothetical protein